MKKLEKEVKGYVDVRGNKLKIGDLVLVRHAFPYTAKLSTGKITGFRFVYSGDLQVKIEGSKKWFFNPWKLAK